MGWFDVGPSLFITVAVFGLVALISFGLAHAGEPQSYWLWHNVLGLIE